jgi:elongation factor 2
VKFSDIIGTYRNGDFEKLQKTLPLHSAILDMAVKHIPNPLEAQGYRVEKIWKGNMTSEVGKAMASCDDHGPTVVCITHVQANPNSGLTATGRVFSGTVKTGAMLYLVNAQTESTIQQVSIYMGAFREPVDQVAAGNIVALTGLESGKAGETLVDVEHKEGMVPFERTRYVSEPVVTVSVEPKNPENLTKLLAAMDKLATEDPNLAVAVNRETGEYLLSGMGELHLEIAVKLLKDYLSGMEIAVSSPTVVYREKATRKGVVATAWSPNRQNQFAVRVEPLDEDFEGHTAKNAGTMLAVGEYKNVLVDCTEKAEQLCEALDFIISGFTFACKSGPLCGEPLRGVKISLMEIQLSENAEQRSPVEIMHGVGKAIFGSFLTAKPVLFEPVYKTVISAPAELAGECSRIISSRRGKISAFEQKGVFAVLTGYIPVAESFGLSAELRSATSGRALWQSLFAGWERVPEKLEIKIIKKVRKRKGLPSEVPKPEQFLEENP